MRLVAAGDRRAGKGGGDCGCFRRDLAESIAAVGELAPAVVSAVVERQRGGLGTALRKTGAAGGRHRCARAGQDRKPVAASLFYSIRLPSLECDQFELTPVQGKNTGEKFARFGFHAGELVLADAGYGNPPGIAAVVGQGADVCVRLNPA